MQIGKTERDGARTRTDVIERRNTDSGVPNRRAPGYPVQCAAMGWTVRGSNPGAGPDFLQSFRPTLRPSQSPARLSAGRKAAGAWCSPRTPHLAPRIKKEKSYIPTLPYLAFVTCSRTKYCFY